MSFAAAAFLGGLLALALPWWLHRRRTLSGRQREVGSLQLMHPAPAPERQHRVLRRRILLALRLGLLAVLALAFAQPLLEADRSGAGAAPGFAPRLVVLDTSMSMAPAFDAAQARARALVRELPAGVPAAVVAAGARIRVLAPFGSDHRRLLAAVDAAAAEPVGLGFGGLLGRLAALAGAFSSAPVEIHLVSDFQASAMPARFNELVNGADTVVVLHAVSGEADNWYVADIALDDAAADAAGTPTAVRVAVTVGGFASRERELTVTLAGPAGELAADRAVVPAGGQARVTMALPADSRGAWLRAAIDGGDAVAADDVAYRAPAPQRSVALPVFAGPGAREQERYLAAAVTAAGAGFRPAAPGAEGPVAVVLDPGELSEERRRLLARHLDTGGAALVTVGPHTVRAGRLVLSDIAVDAVHRPRSPSGVTAVDTAHPALARFGAWDRVTVFRHLTPREAVPALAALDDGMPLLIERRVGAGRLLVLLTALDPQWSTLVAEPAFVTFIADGLAYLADDHLPTAAVAGQPLSVPAASLQIFDQQGQRRLGLGETVGRPEVRLEQPGIYTLRTPSRQQLLAVNAPLAEADLTPVPEVLLERWREALGQIGANPAAAAVPAGPTPLPLAPWLLLVLLLLALGEPLAANLGWRGTRA